MEAVRLSVLMSIYAKDHPGFLDRALDSVERQSLPADEVVIVQDGPLGGELEAVVAGYARRLPVAIVGLPRNLGLGAALRAGVERCRGELIARMDSDDLCVPNRLEVQARAFAARPDLDAVGGAIAEFVSDPARPVGFRRPPLAGDDLARWARSRNPLNHMTAMFRRKAALRAGNYQPFSDFEDYHLWVRMLAAGSRFLNLPEVLVLVRVGNGMLERRRGLRYARAEIAFQRFLASSGFISPARCAWNSLWRVPVRLVPRPVGQLVYRRLLRSR